MYGSEWLKGCVGKQVEAALGEEDNGGHPALRAEATPLVVAQALQDKHLQVSTQQLHKQEHQAALTDSGAHAHAHTLEDARTRKEDAEGAEMVSKKSIAHGLPPLPRSLAPRPLSKREIDERDDVVGTRWNQVCA